MTAYGVQPTGFVRKPLSVILAEIEAAMVTEFGPGVIQTPQSPFGQINGLFADLAAELWERAEDTYQSYDPEQAEGVRLDTLARMRLLTRGTETDADFRRSITNEDRARIDLQDLAREIQGLAGVTYSMVFVNETAAIDENGIPPGAVSVAVIGGADDDIGSAVRKFVVPGVNSHGNYPIYTEIDGFCRTVTILRPIDIPVTLNVTVRTSNDRMGCPPPAPAAIKAGLIEDWAIERTNGKDVSFYTVRALIESRFDTVEVISIQGERDMIVSPVNQTVDIAFIEIASLADANVTITVL